VEEVSTEFTTHMLQALGDVNLVKTLNEMESLSAGHVIDSLPFEKVGTLYTTPSSLETESLKGGLLCFSPRWAAGRNRSPAAIEP
jgi:hypothetical protein